MKPGDYRREYAACCSALELARYESRAGLAAESRLELVRERYGDLWTRESVANLVRARDETPAGFETERAGLDLLVNAARLGYAEERAREASEELSRCEAAARVAWGGERVHAGDVPRLLGEEADAGRRRELSARLADALRPCDDLRAARLEALHEAARSLEPDRQAPSGELAAESTDAVAADAGDSRASSPGDAPRPGFGSYGALLARATRTDTAQVLRAADALLERTARVYDTHLRRWAARHLPPAVAREPSQSDRFFLARLASLDRFFPANDARAAFDATMRSLGLPPGRQTNLRVEETGRAGAGESHCFGVSPPDDVRLVSAPRAGADFFARHFFEAARAQQLAWCSRELAASHPEFVRAPDGANAAGFGFLFRHLLLDPVWLSETRGLSPAEAGAAASACALVEMHDARRDAALVHDWSELDGAAAARSESPAQAYAARQTEATGFVHTPAHHLADVTADGAAAAARLRGRLFAAAAAEGLRTRRGRRWWSSRAAGDALVDLWNTCARHPVEELAPLADFGTLDPELLSAQLNAALEAG